MSEERSLSSLLSSSMARGQMSSKTLERCYLELQELLDSQPKLLPPGVDRAEVETKALDAVEKHVRQGTYQRREKGKARWWLWKILYHLGVSGSRGIKRLLHPPSFVALLEGFDPDLQRDAEAVVRARLHTDRRISGDSWDVYELLRYGVTEKPRFLTRLELLQLQLVRPPILELLANLPASGTRAPLSDKDVAALLHIKSTLARKYKSRIAKRVYHQLVKRHHADSTHEED